jgi:glycosyltransferase involved in cell wall biosynthesis
MVGRGDRRPYLKMAEDLGISRSVDIGPAVSHDQLVKTMRRFSVFCMPSRAESFGVSAVEAASCGLPVVACRVGGIPEIVEDGRSGLLCDPEDEFELARALSQLLSDAKARREMGKEGRRVAIRKFEWSRNVDQMETLYRRVVKG